LKAFRFLSRRRRATNKEEADGPAATPASAEHQPETRDEPEPRPRLFGTLPASQLGAVKHFIEQLKRGATGQGWIETCRPVLTRMLESAEVLGMADVAARVRDLRAAVSMARTEEAQQIDSFARGLILSCWDEFAAVMPEPFELSEEDRRRENIILQALLGQIPEVGRATFEKLHGAGFTSLDVLQQTSAEDLAATTGLSRELSELIGARVRTHREVLEALGRDDASPTQDSWLSDSVSELGKAHQAFERASEAEALNTLSADEKRENRRRCNTCALQVEVVLAELDQLPLLEELQKLGLGPRIEKLEAYVRGDLSTEDEQSSP
jgi:hypothetical protein